MVNSLIFAQYQKMWGYINTFKKNEGRLPNYIDIAGFRIRQNQFLDMQKRAENYKKVNGIYPGNIGIEKALDPVPPKPDPNSKPAIIIKLEAALPGTFKTATEFYNLVKKKKYGNYKNDIYPQGESISRLKANDPLNCSDFSQLGYAAIQGLNQMGKKYQADYLHVACRDSNGNYSIGHIVLRIKGEEFKDWTIYDLAEAASGKKEIGSTMCLRGYKVNSRNDPWLMSDDGKT